MHRLLFLLLLPLATLAQPTSTQREAAQRKAALQKSVMTPGIVSETHTALMNQYDVLFHHFDLMLQRTSTFVRGRVLTRARVVAEGFNRFGFELHPSLTVDSARVNGVVQPVSRNEAEGLVVLDAPVSAGTVLEVEIFYQGLPTATGQAALSEGINNAVSPAWGNRVTWTLSEPYAAYEWWPCKQVLGDKADSVWIDITTDVANKAGSNGRLARVVELGNGQHRFEWRTRYPIAYYLISATVAQFVEYNLYAHPAGSADSVLIQNFIYDNPETLPTFQEEIDLTAGFLELFSTHFGLYPFYLEKYGHCMAPISGGMEHQTMTTQGFFTFTLTAHELTHQWFGDHVTCASWQDIWLNEGFASYGEYLALEHLGPDTARSWMIDAHNFARPSGGSVFVTDTTDVNRIFDYRLSYKKGGAIVHTMRSLIRNDSLFFAGLRAYQERFGGGVASAADLHATMEEVTGTDLDAFFQEWYHGTGHPTYDVQWNQQGANLVLFVTQGTTGNVPLFTTPLEIEIRQADGSDTLVRLEFSAGSEVTRTLNLGTSPVTEVVVDPHLWLVQSSTVQKNEVLTSADAGAASGYKLYPNPSHHEFRLEMPTGAPRKARIYDTQGRELKRLRLERASQQIISVAELAAGRYFLRIGETVTLPFVKE